MKRFAALTLCFCATIFSLFAQQDSIRNVIVMIPDGTSASVLSLARWYKGFQEGRTDASLHLDPYLCGMVKTFSSDAPIGDSAPTTSCYMSGMQSQAGYNSMYPPATDHDLVPVDATRTYQPLMTAFEAARILRHKSVGIVISSHITDATPADCVAHYFDRGNSEVLTKQMAHNNIDVLLGGGNLYAKQYESMLKENGVNVVFDDLQAFRANQSSKMWALFCPKEMPYNLDRDTSRFPSLAEMTETAIRSLTQNEQGFVLMVEGSKVDWAAHDNDAKTVIDEFLEFDKAVKVALDFAQKDGHTVVVILPDHGTGAISMGNRNCNHGYSKLSISQIIEPLTHFSISAEKMGDLVENAAESEVKSLFEQYFQIEITQSELDSLLLAKANINEKNKGRHKLTRSVTKVLSQHTYIGFTTYGHTGEDVFLAVYHPFGDIPTGLMTNAEINQYLCKQLQIENRLPALTDDYYAKHQEVFAGFQYEIDKSEIEKEHGASVRLIVKNKKQIIEIESFTNYFLLNGKKIFVETPIIYVSKNETFYLPKKVGDYLKE